MEQSRTSSRSSTRSPKALFTLLSETPRDYSAVGELGRQEPSLFSGRRHPLAPETSVFQLHRASPFKQAVQGSRLQVRSRRKKDFELPASRGPLHPGENLMARTERSLEQVKQQILADEVAAPGPGRRVGRLQRGHLQPMRLARVHGPPIHLCRGILPQKAVNTYGVSATVQRHGQIIANLDTTRQMYHSLMSQHAAAAASASTAGGPGVNPAGRFRPDTSESLHRTSIASEEELDVYDEFDDSEGNDEGDSMPERFDRRWDS